MHAPEFRWTHDTSRDVLVRDGPGEGEVAHVGAELFGELGQFPHFLELGLSGVALEEFGLFRRSALDVDGESRSLGQAVVVLAREYTLLERRPDGAARVSHGPLSSPQALDHSPAVVLPLPEGVVLDLESLSVQHRVVGLLSDGTDHVESSSNLVRLLDLV